MEALAPHALRRIINALLRRLTRPPHRRARRAAPTAPIRTRRRIAPAALVQKPVYPEPRLLAHDVRIIRRRHETDRLGRPRVQVTRRVHALLHHVRRQRRLVVDHDVVRRLDGALKTRVRLEVEVKVQHRRHTLVDDGSRARVPVLVGEVRVGRVEARVVPLATDDDAQRRVVPRVLGVDAFERFEYLRELLLDYFVVLTLFVRSVK
jgi:hypothetical protein